MGELLLAPQIEQRGFSLRARGSRTEQRQDERGGDERLEDVAAGRHARPCAAPRHGAACRAAYLTVALLTRQRRASGRSRGVPNTPFSAKLRPRRYKSLRPGPP